MKTKVLFYDYQERESDIIYKAKLNEQVYFYTTGNAITVDYTMPFRLLIYMTELWKRFFAIQTKMNEKEKL